MPLLNHDSDQENDRARHSYRKRRRLLRIGEVAWNHAGFADGKENFYERENRQQKLRSDDLGGKIQRPCLNIPRDGLVILAISFPLFAVRAVLSALIRMAAFVVRTVAMRALDGNRLAGAKTDVGRWRTESLRHQQCENAQQEHKNIGGGTRFQRSA